MYTLQQQTFALSLLSNKASDLTGTVAQLEADATTVINDALGAQPVIDQIGSWQIAWGPIVFQESGSNVADNTMVVYQGTSGGNPVYVVGIAGTNALSKFDVDVEDLDVKSTVAFGSDGAAIAMGTSIGVQNLENNMTDPSGGTLQSFLTSKAARNATLIFAGHSLGGALAPTLALDLTLNQGFDVSGWANVYVYPSAGPTPGNKAFSGLFAQTFPPTQAPAGQAWNVWNMDVVNSLDIVPHAWSELPSLPKLYPQLGLAVEIAVTGLVDALTAADGLNAQGYTVLPTSSFTGTYNPTPPPAPPAKILSKLVPTYYNEAYYQHIAGYMNAIIPNLFPEPSAS